MTGAAGQGAIITSRLQGNGKSIVEQSIISKTAKTLDKSVVAVPASQKGPTDDYTGVAAGNKKFFLKNQIEQGNVLQNLLVPSARSYT